MQVMKRILTLLVIALLVLHLSFGQSLWATPSLGKSNYASLLAGEINVLKIFPKEKVEEISGRKFVAVRPTLNKTTRFVEYACEYREEATKYHEKLPLDITKLISISFVRGEVKGIRNAYKLSSATTKQDPKIPFPHQLIFDQKGRFTTLEIFLADNLDLIVNTWNSTLTQKEALKFVEALALYFKGYLQKLR